MKKVESYHRIPPFFNGISSPSILTIEGGLKILADFREDMISFDQYSCHFCFCWINLVHLSNKIKTYYHEHR
jgi:hypothetical protein